MKRSQSASHGKVGNYNQEIIREYQQLIPNTERRDYADDATQKACGRRVRSRSGLGLVSGDKAGCECVVSSVWYIAVSLLNEY